MPPETPGYKIAKRIEEDCQYGWCSGSDKYAPIEPDKEHVKMIDDAIQEAVKAKDAQIKGLEDELIKAVRELNGDD